MPKRDRQSLEDMLAAARKALAYSHPLIRDTLPAEPM
jgi:uncharacterized protein with HEPN domain